MSICVFAGTFDPITKGHEEVINKCLRKFDKVLVVIGENPDKKFLFNSQERLSFVTQTFSNNDRVEVILYSDHKDDYIKFLEDKGVKYYVRGIRDKKDIKYEKSWAKINKKIYPKIKTKYMRIKNYKSVSSTIVKELLKENKADQYLPDKSCESIKTAFIKKLEKE